MQIADHGHMQHLLSLTEISLLLLQMVTVKTIKQ